MSLSSPDPWARPTVRKLQRGGGMAAMAALALLVSPAKAEMQPRLVVDAAVILSSNPFMEEGRDQSAVIGELSARPSLAITSVTGLSLAIEGVFTERRYSRRYGDFHIGNVEASGVYRRSERLSVFVSGELERGLLADALTSGIDAVTDVQGLHEDYAARAGLIWTPDPYFRFEPEISWVKTHYPSSSILRDTRVAAAEIAISGRMSPYATLGARIGAADNWAEGQSNFTSLSGFVTLDQRLSPHWRASIEIGAERNGAHVILVPGALPRREAAQTRLAGQAEICKDGRLLTMCLGARLDSEVSGLGGLERRAAASLTASRRLGRLLTLRTAAEYQHASVEGTDLPSLDSMRADARLEWQLSRRLSLWGMIEYRRRELIAGDSVDAGFVGVRLRYDWRRL